MTEYTMTVTFEAYDLVEAGMRMRNGLRLAVQQGTTIRSAGLAYEPEHNGDSGTAELFCSKTERLCTFAPLHRGTCSDYPWTLSPMHTYACGFPGTTRVRVGIEGWGGPYEAIVRDWYHKQDIMPGFTIEVLQQISRDGHAALQQAEEYDEDHEDHEDLRIREDGIVEAVVYPGRPYEEIVRTIEPDEDGIYWLHRFDWQFNQIEILGN